MESLAGDYLQSKNRSLRSVVLLLLAAVVFLMGFVWDDIRPHRDFCDEVYTVKALAAGVPLYAGVSTVYPPLSYRAAWLVLKLTGLQADDAVQLYTYAVDLLILAALGGIVASLRPKRLAWSLLVTGLLVMPAFLVVGVLQTWRLGNALGVLFTLLWLWELSARDRWPRSLVTGLGLAVLAMLAKQTYGLLLLGAVTLYGWLRLWRQPGHWWSKALRGVLLGLALLGGFAFALLVLWGVLVGPDWTYARIVLLPVEIAAGHNAYYGFGLLPMLASSWVYIALYVLAGKTLLLVSAGFLWWSERRAGERGLTDRTRRALVVIGMNLVSLVLLFDHGYQATIEVMVTLASLVILLNDLGQGGYLPQWPLPGWCARLAWYIPLWIAMLLAEGTAFFLAARLLLPPTEQARINPNLTVYSLSPADLAAMHTLKANLEQAMPDVREKGVWVIDIGGTGFIHLLLDAPAAVRHPYAMYGEIDAFGFEDEYVTRVRARQIDYVLVGRSGELFGQPLRTTYYLTPTVPLTNRRLWESLLTYYEVKAVIPYPYTGSGVYDSPHTCGTGSGCGGLAPAWEIPTRLPAYILYVPKKLPVGDTQGGLVP